MRRPLVGPPGDAPAHVVDLQAEVAALEANLLTPRSVNRTRARDALLDVIAHWKQRIQVERDAAHRLDPGTRERELLEHSADTYECCIADVEEVLNANQ